MYQPSKETVLHRFARQLGPQRTAAHLLSHLGDKAVFQPFAIGEEPNWKEVLIYLLYYNRHISVHEVMANLNARSGEE